MISDDAKAQLRRLMEARDRRDRDEVAAKQSEKDYREIEAEVFETLEDSGVKGSIKVDLGEPWGTVSFGARETYFGRIIDEEAALAYYEQRAMLDEITTPKFSKKRINEEVRDAREQGLDMPPGIDWYARRGVTITRQKS